MMVRRSADQACIVVRAAAEINDSLRRQWQSLLENCAWPHFFQSPAWFESFQHESGHVAVITTVAGEFRAVSVVRERKMPIIAKSKYFIDGGPVAADLESLRTHLRQLRELLEASAIWVRVAPYVAGVDRDSYQRALLAAGYIERKRSMGYSSTVFVDLQPPLADIKRKFRRSLKTQLNKSERIGIEVSEVDTPEDFRTFMINLNLAKGNPPGSGTAGMDGEAMYRNFISDAARGICLVARLDGRILAGILVLAAGERAVYQWGFSDKADKGQAPLSHRLHWEALKWARAMGFRKYDLGGYWLERGDADPINRFKTGFSRHIDELCGEFQLTLSPFAGAIVSSAEQVRMRIAKLRYVPPMKRVGARVHGA